MAKTTEIGWTATYHPDGSITPGSTWNPWTGCKKVSAGCSKCYMFRDKKRYGQDPTKIVRSKTTFNDPLKWKSPMKVFTCSWSDFFIEDADAWRDDAWGIIKRTPHLTYQILTKRPERMAGRLPWGPEEAPWPNVWLGVSVENQMRSDERIPILLGTPAKVRFLSCEPLLEAVDLKLCQEYPSSDGGTYEDARHGISWVIAGGESGPGCRPMDLAWARSLRDQCQKEGVAYFFKQLGGELNHGAKLEEIPEDLRVRQFPKTEI